jgi:outer membrane protein assembly factor BamB
VDAVSGETAWKAIIDGSSIATLATDAAGVSVYVASETADTPGTYTWLYAFNGRTGATRWCWKITGMLLSKDRTPPLPWGPAFYVALGASSPEFGPGPGAILGLDARDGSLGWSISTTSDFGAEGALMAGGVLFVMKRSGELAALRANDGTPLWSSGVAQGQIMLQSPAML